jgi:acyl carrier protein
LCLVSVAASKERRPMGSADDQVRGEVVRVVALVLGRPADVGAINRGSEPTWDSLKHVELLFALEDELQVRFDENELAALTSTDAIAESVARHRGAP